MARIVLKAVGNFVKHVVPYVGLVSYGTMSCHTMDPELLPSTVSRQQWATILLTNSIIGIASYLYRSKHMRNMERIRRLMFSLLGSSLFSLGSVLPWLLVRAALRNSDKSIGIIFSLLSAAVVTKLGRDYVRNCDKLCEQS